MGRFVICAYKPKPGKATELLAVVRKHIQVLSAEGLVSERPPYAMLAQDGTVIEVFEWKSAEAIKQAHSNAVVHALWAEFGAACDCVPLTNLSECHQMFAEFEPVDL